MLSESMINCRKIIFLVKIFFTQMQADISVQHEKLQSMTRLYKTDLTEDTNKLLTSHKISMILHAKKIINIFQENQN